MKYLDFILKKQAGTRGDISRHHGILYWNIGNDTTVDYPQGEQER